MKITDLRVYITRPKDSNRSWLFVEIDTDEGITGVGESTNSGGGGALVVGRAYEMLRHDLEGQDFSEGIVGEHPFNIDAIWHRIYRRFGTLGSRGFATTLASGIDIALWDIKGKALGRPVWDLLGGKMRDSVPVYSHVGSIDDIDACIADARRQVALGYQALKLDPFSPEMGKHHRRYVDGKISPAGADYAEKLMQSLREAVGSGIELMIDAHGNFDVSTATELCNRMVKFKLIWFEEPLRDYDTMGLKLLSDALDMPVAATEYLPGSIYSTSQLIAQQAVDIVRASVPWRGGITDMIKIARLAEAFGINCEITSIGAMNGFVHAHVIGAIRNCTFFEGWSPGSLGGEPYITNPIQITGGHICVPDGPGLGVEFDWNEVEKATEAVLCGSKRPKSTSVPVSRPRDRTATRVTPWKRFHPA